MVCCFTLLYFTLLYFVLLCLSYIKRLNCSLTTHFEMTNENWTASDYVVLIKAYIEADVLHMEEEVDLDFWETLNEKYNNHTSCRIQRPNLATRSAFCLFTTDCMNYRKVIDDVKKGYRVSGETVDVRLTLSFQVPFKLRRPRSIRVMVQSYYTV